MSKIIFVKENTQHCKDVFDVECTEIENKMCPNCESLYDGEVENILFELEYAGYTVEDIRETHYIDTKFDLFRVWGVEIYGKKTKQPDLMIISEQEYDSIRFNN